MFSVWNIYVGNYLCQNKLKTCVFLLIGFFTVLFSFPINLLLMFTTAFLFLSYWRICMLWNAIFIIGLLRWFLLQLRICDWLLIPFNELPDLFWLNVDSVYGHASCCCEWILFFNLNFGCLIELVRSKQT